MQSVKSQIRDLKSGKVKLIEGDDKARTKKCMAEINEILEAYDCIMIPEFLFSGTNLQNRIKIMPKPRNIIKPGTIIPPGRNN